MLGALMGTPFAGARRSGPQGALGGPREEVDAGCDDAQVSATEGWWLPGDELQRVQWLQAVLDAAWPAARGFIERDVIRLLLEPQLSAAAPGLCFAEVDLGDVPPKIHGVQVQTRHRVSSGCLGRSKEEATTLRLLGDVEFSPGPTLRVSIAFGPIQATVSEVFFRGRFCASAVGLVARLPVVQGLRFFFVNPPHLRFEISQLRGLPVAPDLLQKLASEALGDLLVLPHFVHLHLDRLYAATAHSSSSFSPPLPPDFLAHDRLAALSPVGILCVSVESALGPVLDRPGHAASGKRGMYAVLAVGSQKHKTSTCERACRGWKQEQFAFFIDSAQDQEIRIDLFAVEHVSDDLVCRSRILVAELANRLCKLRNSGLLPATRIVCAPPAGSSAAVEPNSSHLAVIVAGAYSPLLDAQRTEKAVVEAVLLLVVDRVVNLCPEFAGQRFSVRASFLPAGLALAPYMDTTPPRAASVGQVSKARGTGRSGDGQTRLAKARKKMLLLRRRGALLTPDEARWLIGEHLTEGEAELLMNEVVTGETAAPSSCAPAEVLFERQLRLHAHDARSQGLRLELFNEDMQRTVGVLEWSSLAWLVEAASSGEEEVVQCYGLAPPEDGETPFSLLDFPGANACQPRIYLRRGLLFVGDQGS